MSICFYITIVCVIAICITYASYFIDDESIMGFCTLVAVFALITEFFLWMDHRDIEKTNKSRLPVRVEMTQKKFMCKPKTVTTFILPGRTKKLEDVDNVKISQVECDLSDIETM